MNIENLVKTADAFNRAEIQKYNPDMEFLYYISLDAGIRLAKKYGADENLVKIGISLMDCKLPEASHLGTPKQHISMSSNATKEFLKEAYLDPNTKENIIKCVEQHHGAEKFFSLEAEIVANSDCYRFIHPKGVLYYSSMLGRRFHNFDKELEQLNFKLNEKHNILSLDFAKEELEPYYEFFQKVINEAKKVTDNTSI